MKSSIKHSILPLFQTTFLRAANILIRLNRIPSIISAVHCPLGYANKITAEDFTLYFENIFKTFVFPDIKYNCIFVVKKVS